MSVTLKVKRIRTFRTTRLMVIRIIKKAGSIIGVGFEPLEGQLKRE